MLCGHCIHTTHFKTYKATITGAAGFQQQDRNGSMAQNRAQIWTRAYVFNWFLTKVLRQFNGERTYFEEIVLEQLDVNMEKKMTSYPRISLEILTDLKNES